MEKSPEQIVEQSGDKSESGQLTAIAFMPKSVFRASSANATPSDFSVSQNQFFSKIDSAIEENQPQTKVNLTNKAQNGKPLVELDKNKDFEKQQPKDFSKIGDQLKLLKQKTKGLL